MKENIIMILFSEEYMCQLLAAEAIAVLYLERRRLFALRAAGAAVLCLGVYIFLADIKDPFPGEILNQLLAGWKYFIPFLVTIVMIRFCFRESMWSILFCCSAAQAMQHLAHRVRNIIMILLHIDQTEQNYVLMALVVFVPIYVLLYFIFFRKLRDKKFPNINNKNLIFTVTACVVLCLFIGVYGYFDTVLNYVIFDLAMILVCFFILCYQFSFLDNTYKQIEYENMCVTLQEMKKQYEMTKENIDIINIKCHDIKKQIRILGEREQISPDSLHEITNAVRIYDSTINTGNPVLDVILTDKSLYCDQNHIQFGCMIDRVDLSFMNPMDLYSLFGNILDNAVEAVKKLENEEMAVINLGIREMKGAVFIHCENYFQGELEFQDEIPVTTKPDKDYHGFGIRSIKFVVEKYGGFMTIVPERDVFNINISVPLKEAENDFSVA